MLQHSHHRWKPCPLKRSQLTRHCLACEDSGPLNHGSKYRTRHMSHDRTSSIDCSRALPCVLSWQQIVSNADISLQTAILYNHMFTAKLADHPLLPNAKAQTHPEKGSPIHELVQVSPCRSMRRVAYPLGSLRRR